MSSVTEPAIATATRREPSLIWYDDSPDAVRAIEAAAALLGPRRAVFVGIADELDAAVIVIGSRGPTGSKKVFDAGVSEQVAEQADRPILIVPPPR